MGFLTQHILGILGSQIEIERIFLVVGVFTSLQQCCFGVENLDKLMMTYKNWPLDAWLYCKLVSGDKLAEFVVVEYMLKENEDMLENAGYLEEMEFQTKILDVR